MRIDKPNHLKQQLSLSEMSRIAQEKVKGHGTQIVTGVVGALEAYRNRQISNDVFFIITVQDRFDRVTRIFSRSASIEPIILGEKFSFVVKDNESTRTRRKAPKILVSCKPI